MNLRFLVYFWVCLVANSIAGIFFQHQKKVQIERNPFQVSLLFSYSKMLMLILFYLKFQFSNKGMGQKITGSLFNGQSLTKDATRINIHFLTHSYPLSEKKLTFDKNDGGEGWLE
jgi:hypothetical protein